MRRTSPSTSPARLQSPVPVVGCSRRARRSRIGGLVQLRASRHDTSRDRAAIRCGARGGDRSFHIGETLPFGQLDLEAAWQSWACRAESPWSWKAPAKFEVNSATGVSLLRGKLVATVPHDVHGFAVTTPDGSVIDLGTQFGVEVLDGRLATEVFQGQVQLQPCAAADSMTTLSAGQAADLFVSAATIDPAGAKSQRFVRDLDGGALSLDMADLLAGGDGTSHRRGGMIDPRTGAAGPMPITGLIDGDSAYHRGSSLPVIDGCFIPNGKSGPVQVDSAGHRFALPQPTGKPMILSSAGTTFLVPAATESLYRPPWAMWNSRRRIIGFSTSTPMSASRSTSLAVRLHPGSTLEQIHATVGNVYGKNPRDVRPTELFVLADGVLRFHRRFSGSDVFTLAVPLSDSDRDLSLIITDGRAGNAGDDILFGDPAFEMVASR